MKGKLILIPTPITESSWQEYIPAEVSKQVKSIKHFIVEELKCARRFIKKIDQSISIDDLKFYEMNEHTRDTETIHYLDACLNGENIGLMSDAGVPCIADPGNIIVRMAQEKNIEVVPLVGPSSILLALMASGLNGQQFSFHGYLPREKNERIKFLKEIEKEIQRKNNTHIFIEAPYRNTPMLEDIMGQLNGNLSLCLGCEIRSEQGYVHTKKIMEWKKNIPDINKKNVVFLLGN